MNKPPPTGVRPFAWADLEADPSTTSPPGPDGSNPGAPVRPYRWADLDGLSGGPDGARAQADPAQAALEAARREADALLGAAREEARKLAAAARREGLEAGRAEGRTALEKAAEDLRRVAAELAGYKEALYREARDQVVELCLALVNRLLGPLAAGDEEAVIRVVERALQLLSDREQLTVRIHPQDVHSLLEAKPRILESFDGIRKLTVLEDPAVKPGGCLVQTPTAEVDARLDTQLAEIVRSLRSA